MSLLDGGGEHPEEECCSEPQYDWSRNPTHWSVKSLNYRLLSSLSLMPSDDRNPVFGQSQAKFLFVCATAIFHICGDTLKQFAKSFDE